MEIPVKLEAFEGPLDLLLHLIDINQINIYDIPIVMITDQYMEYLDQMEETDLNSMSEFLLMAATLLDIKCRMLLPTQEVTEEGEEIDPRAELVEQLRQYKMFKYISQELKEREQMTGERITHDRRLPEEVLSYKPEIDTEELLSDLTLSKLSAIFRGVLRAQDDKIDPIRSRFGKIKKEEVSLQDKVGQIAEYAQTHASFSFKELLTKQSSRVQVIVTFLAILELIKTGALSVTQENLFDDIYLETMTNEAKETHESDRE